MSGVGANGSDSKVETISRLAQWKIESFGPCSYRRSDAFKLGIWNRFLSVEKNRYMYIRLFPEPCRVSKEQPPIARFVLRVSNPGPGRRPYISPVRPHPWFIENISGCPAVFIYIMDGSRNQKQRRLQQRGGATKEIHGGGGNFHRESTVRMQLSSRSWHGSPTSGSVLFFIGAVARLMD